MKIRTIKTILIKVTFYLVTIKKQIGNVPILCFQIKKNYSWKISQFLIHQRVETELDWTLQVIKAGYEQPQDTLMANTINHFNTKAINYRMFAFQYLPRSPNTFSIKLKTRKNLWQRRRGTWVREGCALAPPTGQVLLLWINTEPQPPPKGTRRLHHVFQRGAQEPQWDRRHTHSCFTGWPTLLWYHSHNVKTKLWMIYWSPKEVISCPKSPMDVY